VAPDKDFDAPSVVMQTAVTTSSTEESLDLYWTSSNKSTLFYIILHASEIQNIPSTALREFDILSDGSTLWNSTTLPKLEAYWYSYIDTGYYEYSVSLKATSNSTLPPLLNAIELYIITPASEFPTNDGDGTFHEFSFYVLHWINMIT
jgi:Malectin-like domain